MTASTCSTAASSSARRASACWPACGSSASDRVRQFANLGRGLADGFQRSGECRQHRPGGLAQLGDVLKPGSGVLRVRGRERQLRGWLTQVRQPAQALGQPCRRVRCGDRARKPLRRRGQVADGSRVVAHAAARRGEQPLGGYLEPGERGERLERLTDVALNVTARLRQRDT